jgi:hypothetical protein
MYLYTQIQDIILQYTGGKITLKSFREQFVPFLLDTPRTDIETKTLAYSVESLYSDLVAGDFDEAMFVKQLNSLFPIAIIGRGTDYRKRLRPKQHDLS